MNVFRHTLFAFLVVSSALTRPAQAQVAAAQTAAGTVLTNIATATAELDAQPLTIASNQTRLTVAERLDVVLRAANTTLRVPAATTAIPFLLNNGGNGNEAFVLSAQIDRAGVALQGFALDRNGDGAFDPAIDLAIPQGGTVPSIAAGQSAALLVLLQGQSSGTPGTLTVHAVALTGSGTPGTQFEGRGDGNSDAIVGSTGAAASLPFTLAVVDTDSSVPITLVKSQQVAGPGGTTVPVPGAIVTYTIVGTFGAPAPAARVTDPIPAGTSYVAGSLSLDGTALSDTADGDAGSFDGSGIAVALGDVPAAATHTVQFKVTVQ